MAANYVNTFGTYGWHSSLPEYNSDIHPDDLVKLNDSLVHQNLLHCINQDNIYITLQYGNLVFRAKPHDYDKLTDHVPFYMNDKVRKKNRSPEVIGTIYRVAWHFKREAPLFFLEINGKKKRSWYLAEDLELVEKAEAEQG